jgi:hypothetical protein
LRALAILSIHEHQSSVVGFSNLTAQWETNPRALGLRGKEWNEEISGIHDPGTVVFNKDLNAISFLTPPERDVSMRFKRGINGVVHQIDQRLFNLRRVDANYGFRTRPDLNLEPGFQIHDMLYQRGKVDVLFLRRRKSCEPGVRLQETA